MIKSRFLAALCALAALGAFSPPARAATVVYVGAQTDLGSGWRTPTVVKRFDLDGDNVIGTDGYHLVNRPAVWPSYIGSTEILSSTSPGDGGYASIDDATNLPSLFVTGTMNPFPGTGVSADIFRFTLGAEAAGRTIRVALLVDNLDYSYFNASALEVAQTNGAGASSGFVATTSPAFNDGVPDWLFFDITGAAAGDAFLVRGLGGPAGGATLGGVAFDSLASIIPGTNFVLEATIQPTNVTNTTLTFSAAAVSGDTVVLGSFSQNLAAVFVRSGTNWVRQAVLTGNNTESGDQFGISVAISSNTIIVGANYEASAANTINGNGGDNSASDAGAAYIFVRNGTNWTQQAYLKASDNASGFYFGGSVALCGDTAVVGTISPRPNPSAFLGASTAANAGAGAAYVFARQGTNWTQQARLTANNAGYGDVFGYSLSLFDDTVVVGAPLEDSGANTINGDGSLNNQNNAGAAYVFVRQGTSWTQQAYLKAANANSGPSAGDSAGDYFGMSVGLSGNTVVVGAPNEDSLGNFYNDFGTNNGAVYVFTRSETNWSQQAFLKATDILYGWVGWTVGISDETVVTEGQFACYVFQRTGTQWSRKPDLADRTLFGDGLSAPSAGVLISGDLAVIHDRNGISIYDSAAPRLVVQDSLGVTLAFGGDSRPMAIQDGRPDNQTFTLLNTGDTVLTNLALTLDGPDAALFSITASPGASIAAGGSTNFTLRFSVGAGTYPKSATLHIASSDTFQGTYNLSLTGYNLLSTVDSDGDGLNDVAKFQLRGLGFNWQVSQVALVGAYFQANPAAGLYTSNQVQALNAGAPLLGQTAPGQFELTFGVQKSTTLTNFLAFPMPVQQTSINGNGELEFLFAAPDKAAFYRLEAH